MEASAVGKRRPTNNSRTCAKDSQRLLTSRHEEIWFRAYCSEISNRPRTRILSSSFWSFPSLRIAGGGEHNNTTVLTRARL